MRTIEAAAGAMGRWERATVAKTTRITVESETVAIVLKRTIPPVWCSDCGAEVYAVILDAGLTSQIQEWSNADRVHVLRGLGGPSRLCLPSLVRSFESAEAQRALRSVGDQLEHIRRKT